MQAIRTEVAEGHQAIPAEMTASDQAIFARMTDGFQAVRSDISELGERMARVETKVEGIEAGATAGPQ